VPPHWLVYVAVASADEAAERAKSLGATIPMAAMNVMDVGRMALIQDPQGAVFAVWGAEESRGIAPRERDRVVRVGRAPDDGRRGGPRLLLEALRLGGEGRPGRGAPYTQWKWGTATSAAA